MKLRQDPRVLHQWLRINGSRVATDSIVAQTPDEFVQNAHHVKPEGQDHVDWSVSLGGTNSIMPRSAFPAKFSFDINAAPSCSSDFVVFGTGIGGSATQASVIAFNNLYSTQGSAGGFCNHNGPTVAWAYNTGPAVLTSPVLSLDGTRVAFVSRNPATLHVLTIGTTGVNGTSATTPVTPGAGNNAVDRKVALSGGHNDTSSSLWVDYQNDVGYAGDVNGVLHKFSGIFNGTPAEVTTGGWPITVRAGATLNDPVLDSTSGNIFITDKTGHLSYVREASSTVGACAAGSPPCLGATSIAVSPGGTAISDGPVVDFVTERVFSETSNGVSGSEVIQADASLGNLIRAHVGAADATNPLHNGDFDNNYLNSTATGFYYVCGKSAAQLATLYRVGFNAAGVMNGAADATTLQLGRGPAQCSPITIFLNSTTNVQWLFVGISNRCGITGVIGGGCMMAINISNGIPAPLACNAAGGPSCVAERNGTSGIIIDNVSSAAQASSVYFTDEGTGPCGDGINTGGCAIKLTQAGLK